MLKLPLTCFALGLALFGRSALGEMSATPTSTAFVNDESTGNFGHSVAPIVGYEPTYRLVVGAAYFFEETEGSFSADASLNFNGVYRGHLRFTRRLLENWEYSITTGGTQGFDPYYGEGAGTLAENRIQITGLKSETHIQMLREFGPTFSAGAFADLKIRTETPDGKSSFVRHFPNETTGGVGIVAIVDTRNDKRNPTEGFTLVGQLTYVPTSLTTVKTLKDFGQLEGSFAVYQEILKGAIPDVIAAFRIMGGHSFGEPSYMYRYRLGGSDLLRGYQDNRFRGKRYYLQQTELRIPIWKMISGASFISFGDATDSAFQNPRMAYGAGIRIGLPPDWVSKLRLDFAWGHDQFGVFADYGQAF